METEFVLKKIFFSIACGAFVAGVVYILYLIGLRVMAFYRLRAEKAAAEAAAAAAAAEQEKEAAEKKKA